MFAAIRTPRSPDGAVAIARAFSPRLQRQGQAKGNECVVCDVSGLGCLLGEPRVIGAELWRACEAVDKTGSVAIAPTQMAARILAHAAAGLTVIDVSESIRLPLINGASHAEARMVGAREGGGPQRKQINDALASISIRVLRRMLEPDAPAAALIEDAFAVFDRWGLTTLGDLAALPADALAARVGRIGVALRTQALGVDLTPLVPDADSPRFFERMELEWPIDGLEPLAFVLARLLEPLATALERADRGAAAIRLDLRLVDRTTHARVLQLPAAMRDPRVLRTLLTLDLESHPPPAAVDVVSIEIDPAPARVVQYSLLERARPSVETLATLTARLSALVGETRIGAPALLDSHQPDAFTMSAFVEATADRSAFAEAPARQTGPEANGSFAMRRFRPPIAVRVDVDHGRPVRVAIARRGLPSGHVEQCAGPWRGSGEWWAHDAQRWDRDEWDVALSDGAVCRLFRTRDTGVWFLEGVID